MEIGLSAEHPQVGGEEFNLVVQLPNVDGELSLVVEDPQVGGVEFNLVVQHPDVDWELSIVFVEQSSPGWWGKIQFRGATPPI